MMKLTHIRNGRPEGTEERVSIVVIDTGTHKFHLETNEDGSLLIRPDDLGKNVTVQPAMMGITYDIMGIELKAE